ncbi:hypothetical protein BS17DRAFT_767451 [Gyrodon lividus]|nr:hypothetical protein BS17DRAFT_767451 [Gyrodon lividus]
MSEDAGKQWHNVKICASRIGTDEGRDLALVESYSDAANSEPLKMMHLRGASVNAASGEPPFNSMDLLASPPISPCITTCSAHSMIVEFSLLSPPNCHRALLAFSEHKGKSSASGSCFIAPATQAPSASSSSVQPADPWALYLKVQSLVQMMAGSWAITADKTNVHQILCLLMELQHLKERLDDAMEQWNYLQDTLGLIDSLS